jgi:hypothetical protein
LGVKQCDVVNGPGLARPAALAPGPRSSGPILQPHVGIENPRGGA